MAGRKNQQDVERFYEPVPDGWVTVTNAEKITGLSRQTITGYCAEGRIESAKFKPRPNLVQGRWYISPAGVEQLKNRERMYKKPIEVKTIPEDMDDDVILTTAEVSIFLQISERVVCKHVRRGELIGKKEHRQAGYKIRVGDLRDYIAGREEKDKRRKLKIAGSRHVVSLEEFCADPYEYLAVAIVKLAIKDYKSLWKRRFKMPPDTVGSDTFYSVNNSLDDIEKFFHSQHFGNLTYNKIDPEWLIDEVRKEAELI